MNSLDQCMMCINTSHCMKTQTLIANTPGEEEPCAGEGDNRWPPPHWSHHRLPTKVNIFLHAQNSIPRTPMAKSEQKGWWVSWKLRAKSDRVAMAKTPKSIRWAPFRLSFHVIFWSLCLLSFSIQISRKKNPSHEGGPTELPHQVIPC